MPDVMSFCRVHTTCKMLSTTRRTINITSVNFIIFHSHLDKEYLLFLQEFDLFLKQIHSAFKYYTVIG